MRYIAFKRHRILISFYAWIAGKKIPLGVAGKERQIILVVSHILRLRMANPH